MFLKSSLEIRKRWPLCFSAVYIRYLLPAFSLTLNTANAAIFYCPITRNFQKSIFSFFFPPPLSVGEICKRVSEHPIAPAARQIT